MKPSEVLRLHQLATAKEISRLCKEEALMEGPSKIPCGTTEQTQSDIDVVSNQLEALSLYEPHQSVNAEEVKRLMRARETIEFVKFYQKPNFDPSGIPARDFTTAKNSHLRNEIEKDTSLVFEELKTLSLENPDLVPLDWMTRQTFDPVQLTRIALSHDGSNVDALTNPIHSIFAVSHWRSISNDIYEAMKPALRLATMFLLHPACAPFWITLLFGDRKVERTESKWIWRIDEWTTTTQELTDKLKVALHTMASEGLILFYPGRPKDDPPYASANPASPCNVAGFERERIPAWKKARENGRVLKHGYGIELDWNWIHGLQEFALGGSSAAHKLRFNFILAATLAHEIAHVVEYRARELTARKEVPALEVIPKLKGYEGYLSECNEQIARYMYLEHEKMEETLMPGQLPGQKPEAGEAFECTTFGAVLNTINGDGTALYGLWYQCPLTQPDRYVAISMRYLATVQSAAFWQQTTQAVRQQLRITDVEVWALNPLVRIDTDYRLLADLAVPQRSEIIEHAAWASSVRQKLPKYDPMASSARTVGQFLSAEYREDHIPTSTELAYRISVRYEEFRRLRHQIEVEEKNRAEGNAADWDRSIRYAQSLSTAVALYDHVDNLYQTLAMRRSYSDDDLDRQRVLDTAVEKAGGLCDSLLGLSLWKLSEDDESEEEASAEEASDEDEG